MRFLHFLYISIASIFILCYVFHKSIVSYIVQQYHYGSDMISMESNFFVIGDVIAKNIDEVRIYLFEHKQNDSDYTNIIHNEVVSQQEDTKNTQDILQEIISQDNIITNDKKNNITKEYLAKGIYIKDEMLHLKPQTHFLLIGDSLMQGIGMTLTRKLRQNNLIVRNIAKQSTGLTYPSFFNWSDVLKQAFLHDPNIAVVVVCLGANDPWNMPKMVFGSDEWRSTYKSRVQNILDIAHNNNAVVIWYEVPSIKDKGLNKKIAYLNEIYGETIEENDGLFLHSNAILMNGKFTSYIKDKNGKSRLVRAQDGIHFARYGSELLSQTLIDKIIVEDIIENHIDMPLDLDTQNYNNEETQSHSHMNIMLNNMIDFA